MTTIVVVKKNGKACIAADTLTGWGGLKQKDAYVANNSKILYIAENYFGLSGTLSHELVLSSYFANTKRRHSFKNKQDIFESWRKLHQILKDNYHLNPQDEKDDEYESSQIVSLLANPHGIFGIYPMRAVVEFTKFWAAGSGMEYALGALHSNYNRFDNVEDIARSAIEAAAEFDEGTELPITLHSVDLLETKTPPSRQSGIKQGSIIRRK
jgi:ATP-dependent HslUV protease, peptidase subunit HslV